MAREKSSLQILKELIEKIALSSWASKATAYGVILDSLRYFEDVNNLNEAQDKFQDLIFESMVEIRQLKGKNSAALQHRLLLQVNSLVDDLGDSEGSAHELITKFKTTGVLPSIDIFADSYSSRFPIALLGKVSSSLNEILERVPDPNLPDYLNNFLEDKLKEVLEVTYDYRTCKSEAVKRASKSAIMDLFLLEIEPKYRKNETLQSFFNSMLALAFGSVLPFAFTAISGVNDSFELLNKIGSTDKQVQKICAELFNEQLTLEECRELISEETKILNGTKERKLLMPASEENTDEDPTETETNEN